MDVTGTGSSSVLRAASHWSRALVWHFGQCRLRQELIGDGLMAASATAIEMTTERRRAAALDGEQHFELQTTSTRIGSCR